MFGSRRGLGLSCRFEDQSRDRVGLRDERNIAGSDLDRFCTHTLGHEALQVPVDGLF